MASKSYDCDLTNLARSSPKMTKNSQFRIFRKFLKYCPYGSNENLYSHSTPK